MERKPINLIIAIRRSLDELLDQLSDSDYTRACPVLSGATVGEHVRHIIEMFWSPYAVRVRRGQLRSAPARGSNPNPNRIGAAKNEQIKTGLMRADKPLLLAQNLDGGPVSIPSNYRRELLYNLEHCIHHQAMIRVALQQYAVEVGAGFGIAHSTLEYKKQCAR